MAAGDITFFQEALAYMIDGDWASTDQIAVGIATNATIPAAGDAAPAFGSGGTTNYTEVTPGGAYSAGGEVLDTLANCVVEAAGTMTFDDTGPSVSWAQNVSNPTNAYYAIVYNTTQAGNDAICSIDLNGPVNMSAGTLTITWNASGIFTIS